MAWTLVNKTVWQWVSGPATSPAINTNGADLIIVLFGGPGAAGLSDNQSNVWSTAVTITPNQTGAMLYVSSPVTNANHTFTFSNGNATGVVLAYSGSYHGPPLDQTNAANITGNGVLNTEQPGLITPAFSGELLVYGNSLDSPQGNTFSVDSGFVVQGSMDVVSGQSFGLVASTLAETGQSSVNPTMTRSLAINNGSFDAAFIASFRAAPTTGVTLISRPVIFI